VALACCAILAQASTVPIQYSFCPARPALVLTRGQLGSGMLVDVVQVPAGAGPVLSSTWSGPKCSPELLVWELSAYYMHFTPPLATTLKQFKQPVSRVCFPFSSRKVRHEEGCLWSVAVRGCGV
jgi:hypothetical protein